MELQYLSEAYKKVCEILYPDKPPRHLLQRALTLLDKRIEEGRGIFVLEAPTGYGKSTLSLAIYLGIKLSGNDIAQRIIHVLPMRSIGTHMHKKMIDEYIPKLQNAGLPVSENDVGLQQMNSPGSPMLCRRFVITTLDTFVSSFYKLPPVELKKLLTRGSAHYEVPRGCIYSAIVVFDEFHLYAGACAFMNGSSKMLTAAIACIICLLEMGVPVIISTATMPKIIKETLFDELETVFGDEIRPEEILPTKEDLNFVNRSITVKTIEEHELFRIIESESRDSKRILIISNTVANSVQIYQALKQRNINATIIHSKMIERDKKARLKKIESGPCIVVSTQVMEAGVDMSFDLLITEAAPPDSILQRSGRVARYGGKGEVFIYPLSKGGEAIYGQELPTFTYNQLREEGELSYDLLNIYDSSQKPKLVDRELYNMLRRIDVYPSYSALLAGEVWKAYCGFVRDSEMIPTVPRYFLEEFIKNPRSRGQYLFIIDEPTFRRLLLGGFIREYIASSNEIRSFEKHFIYSKNGRCMSEVLYKYDVLAVIVENYDEEVGLPS